MRCREIQELISAYFDGALDPSVKDTVDAHLKGCAACRLELEDLSVAVGLVRNLPPVEPPVEFGPTLRERLNSLNKPGRPQGTLRGLIAGRWSAVAAVAASFLLVVGLAGVWPGLARFGGAGRLAGVNTEMADRAPADAGSFEAVGSAPVAGADGAQKEKTFSINYGDAEEKGEADAPADKVAVKVPVSCSFGQGQSENAKIAATPHRIDFIGGGEAARGTVNGTPVTVAAPSPPMPERAILDIKAVDPGAAVRHISDIARLYGGTVSVDPETGGREMTVTIPDSRFEEVMAEISKTGTVISDERPATDKAAEAPEAQETSIAPAPLPDQKMNAAATQPGACSQERSPGMSVIKIIIE